MSRRRVALRFVLLAAAMLVARDSHAQSLSLPSARPSDGIFGRAPKGGGLDVAASVVKGFDDDLIGEGQSQSTPGTGPTGQFDGVDFALLFAQNGRHFSFSAGERSSVRYYSAPGDLMAIRHNLAGGVSAQFQKTAFNVSQTVAYTPFYSFSTLPVVLDAQPTDVPVLPDQVLTYRPAMTWGTSGEMTHTMGRATLSFVGMTQQTNYTEETGPGFGAVNLNGRMVYHLSRDLGLVVGYGVQRGSYAVTPVRSQDYDFRNTEIGLDYNRAISLTRRTKVGFTTGTTAVRTGDGTTGYRMVGEGRISREFGRTWLATATYRRGVGLIAGFEQPIFADSLALNVAGQVSRRVSWSTSGGFSSGEVTATATPNHTTYYSSSTRLQMALTRMLALFGEFGYYRYGFDNSVGLPAGINQRFDRRSARVGLTVWLPLLH